MSLVLGGTLPAPLSSLYAHCVRAAQAGEEGEDKEVDREGDVLLLDVAASDAVTRARIRDVKMTGPALQSEWATRPRGEVSSMYTTHVKEVLFSLPFVR